MTFLLYPAAFYGYWTAFILFDCITGWSAFMLDWVPGGSGGASILPEMSAAAWFVGGLVTIAAVITLLSILFWREFALAMIRGLTEEKGKHWARDWLVRWLWKRCGDRKLKSVASIAKAARGLPLRVRKRVAANDNRAGRRNVLPVGFVEMRGAA